MIDKKLLGEELKNVAASEDSTFSFIVSFLSASPEFETAYAAFIKDVFLAELVKQKSDIEKALAELELKIIDAGK